jgi:hypothetical protein
MHTASSPVIDPRSSSVPLRELPGVWSRSLYVRADGTVDDTTEVTWVQAASSYVDLRQPARRPDLSAATCLRALTFDQTAWLATQEGFAGYLRADDREARWERFIDVQPASPPDVGRLSWRGDVLLEEGIDLPYVEHWERVSASDDVAGLRLVDPHLATVAVLARVGETFGFARSREIRIGGPPATPARVAAARDLRSAQDLVNFELSVGTVSSGRWTIERSSLPFRVGADLAVAIDGTTCHTRDLTPDGEDRTREWRVVAAD